MTKRKDDENSAEAVQNRSMERLSEIKKREAVEPQTKRDRNNGSEATQLRGEKYENDREIGLKELELKKQELELKTKELERNEKQTDALILQRQQQTHALMMLLGKFIEK